MKTIYLFFYNSCIRPEIDSRYKTSVHIVSKCPADPVLCSIYSRRNFYPYFRRLNVLSKDPTRSLTVYDIMYKYSIDTLIINT